jgi:hypothetical protein
MALAVLDECRQAANAAAARLAHTARDLWEVRLCAAELGGADAGTVSRSAIAEVAVVLGCSQAMAKTMIDTAQLLEFRAPIVNEVPGWQDAAVAGCPDPFHRPQVARGVCVQTVSGSCTTGCTPRIPMV